MRALALLCLLAACGTGKDEGPEPPAISAAWSDDFERSQLGGDWRATGDGYQLVNGAVNAQGAFNHPLWLRKQLPRDAAVELDVWSTSPDGDIKVELYGDVAVRLTPVSDLDAREMLAGLRGAKLGVPALRQSLRTHRGRWDLR